MELQIIKQPYQISFAGNPVQFTFALTPYRDMEQAQNFKLIVRVEIEDILNSGQFTQTTESIYNPQLDGLITIDIKAILKSYLVQYIPSLKQAIPYAIPEQCKRYRLTYRLLQDSILVDGTLTTTDIFYILKGGLSYQQWHPKKYFEALLDSKTFLRYPVQKEMAFADERKYLSWVYPYADNLMQYLQYDIGLSDGSIISGPPSPDDQDVYKENSEWLSFSDAGADFNYTDTPHSGSKSVNIASFTDGQHLYFTAPGSVDINNYKYLRFFIKIRSAYINAADFIITFLNAGVSITQPLGSISYGFNRSLLDQWQQISIPLDSLVKTGSAFDTIYFKLNYGNEDGFQIDDITLQAPKGELAIPAAQWQVFITPAGFNQLGLNDIVPFGKTAIWWQVNIVNQNNIPVCFPQRFYLDYRQFYQTRDLLYIGSLGNAETIRLRGQVDAETEYEKINAERVTPPDYYNNTILDSINENIYNAEQEIFKGDTGFVSRETLDRLRDLINAKTIYEIKDGRLIPVNITNKNAKWYTNKQKLFSLPVEWQHAFTNEYYTPYGLIGTTEACPAVEKISVRQTATKKLSIAWSLETGYNKIGIDIIIDGVTIASNVYTGNYGQKEIDFENPVAPFETKDVLIAARTICNELADPQDVGPLTTIILTVSGKLPPVAMYDLFTVYKTSSPILKQLDHSVLDNDYDHDGDALSVLPVTGGVSDYGGSFSIDAQGIVMYAPPSMAVPDGVTDRFVYWVTNGTLQSVANVYISFGNAPGGDATGNVYVKLVTRNTRTNAAGGSAGSYTYYIYAEKWLEFYKDAAGTRKMNLTDPLAVTILKKTYALFTTDENINYNASGYEMKIFDGLVQRFGDTSSPLNIIFSIQPGAGYQAI